MKPEQPAKNFKIFDAAQKRRMMWVTKETENSEDSEERLEKCTKRYVRNVKKNVKSLLSQKKAVRYIVRNVFLSARIVAVKS